VRKVIQNRVKEVVREEQALDIELRMMKLL
jgi:hypothetical protein